MTVQTNTNVASFLGNGAATYPIGFKFNSAADLVVQKTVIATGVTTTLTLNSDYSVAGAGVEEGGSITFSQAPTSAESIKVTRVVDLLQLTDLRNQGKFYAEVHEAVFDKLVMIDQQQQTEIDDANAKSDEAVATANAANAKSDQAVAKAAQNLVDMQAQYDAFEQGASFVVIGDYAAGLVVDGYNKIFRKDGEFYRAKAELTLPYPLNGDWAVDAPKFVSVGDAVLRQDLTSTNQGAAIIGRGVVSVASVSDLVALPSLARRSDLRYVVAGYHAGSTVGGGEFVWDASRSAENDQGYVINGFVRVSRGPVLVEHFGAQESADGSTALQNALLYLKAAGGRVTSSLKGLTISSPVIFFSNTEIDLGATHVTFSGTGKLVSALFNANRTEYIAGENNEQYYNLANTVAAGNPAPTITADAAPGATSLSVSDSAGISAGDYLWLSNGYCDMWRVMEQYTGTTQAWVNPAVDLWRTEVIRVESVSGNTLTLSTPLENEYKVAPKTYGLFDDENALASYVPWNTPRAVRLGGVSDVSIKIKRASVASGSFAVLAYLCARVSVSITASDGAGRGVVLASCYDSHIATSDFKSTAGWAAAIRRGSSACTISRCSATHYASDAPVLIFEGANDCHARDISVIGSPQNPSSAKIGVYLNTCWNCSATGISGRALKTLVMIGYSRGGNRVSGLTGVNVNLLCEVYRSFDDRVSDGVQSGFFTTARNDSTNGLFIASDSCGVEFARLRHTEAPKDAEQGRIHLFRSFDITLTGIRAANLILHHSVADDRTIGAGQLAFSVTDALVLDVFADQTQTVSDTTTHRQAELFDVTIRRRLRVFRMHSLKFTRTKIQGLAGRLAAVELGSAHFTSFVDCNIKHGSVGINFLPSGFVSGNENRTSLIYMRNTTVEAPTRFQNYADPAYMISQNTVGTNSRGIAGVTGLLDFPALKEWRNPAGDGNTTGWRLVAGGGWAA